MALFRHRDPEPTPEPTARNSLVASSMLVTESDARLWGMYSFGDESWQTELWRLYDLVGEFRFIANWVGSACSRVRIYVADVDSNGRVQQESEDDEVAGLADVIFGGPANKAEAVRSIGVNLTVTGECYVLGIDGGKDPDEWFVVSGSELRRRSGGYDWRPSQLPRRALTPGKDLIMRLWTPHPRDSWSADSPGRGAMQVLVELERLTRFVFAQIDSRLINAGIVFLPNNMDFPDDGTSTSAAEAFTNRMVKAASASLQGAGTAAGVVPMFIEVPMDALGKVQDLQLSSELSKQAMDLRSEAIRRLALAMDIPPDVLTGSGDINHWQAWFTQESGIKIHIEPIMNRICDALTSSYLKKALKLLGKDPERYTFWYDTSPLTVRPERLQDALNLYSQNLLSGDAVRLAGNFAISDAPENEETAARFLKELLLRDPSLFATEGIRDLIGIDAEMLPPELATPPPPPPPPTQGIEAPTTTPIPQRSIAPGAPPRNQANQANAGNAPPARTASATPVDHALMVGADLAVRRALELAGGRLLTRADRGRYRDVPRSELHTRIKVNGDDHLATLLAGAWDHIPALADMVGDVDPYQLTEALRKYVTIVLVAGMPHEQLNLHAVLAAEGLVGHG